MHEIFSNWRKNPDKLWLDHHAAQRRSPDRRNRPSVEKQHQHAELGYWLGVPFWGHGYATEAAREILRYGFEMLALHRIFASHFKHNPASGRILTKIGMKHEGCQREHLRKWDQFVDSELYGILRREWEARE